MRKLTNISFSQYLRVVVFYSIAVLFSPKTSLAKIPQYLQQYVSQLYCKPIGTTMPNIQYKLVGNGLVYIEVVWNIKDSTYQDDVQIKITPSFVPTFHWAPHITPADSNIIAQHVFRCPALIVQSAKKTLSLVPDLTLLKLHINSGNNKPGWYLDQDASRNQMLLGLSFSAIHEHVLYYKKKGAIYPPGKLKIGFYLFFSEDSSTLFDPWKTILSFEWKKWGFPLYKQGEPLDGKDLMPDAAQTYKWAFSTWKQKTWQDIVVDEKEVGAPTFIVNVTQSPNWKSIVNERETRSVWNQAWFNSLRSAMGLFRYAKETNNDTLLRYAEKTKDLALSFPQINGFFYSVIATEMDTFHFKEKVFNKSKGWEHYYWGNSNRNPFTWDIRKSPFHILDMSYTAYWMLCWYEELEKDPKLLQYAKRYADALLHIQDKDGFLPAWLDLDTQKPMGYLDKSPETSMSVTFLLKIYSLSQNINYKNSALKALKAVQDNIVLQGKWEDFETYWSCSRYGADTLVGKKITRNDMYKQNTLSMYYTAQAFYEAYQLTKSVSYLQYGQRVLDEMLMFQATWQPPYMYVNVLGGFGVMNGDAEWNDSRQSLFAELILQYGKALNDTRYTQRGIAALKASFVMMYSPLNEKTKKQWESRWSFFGKKDYGFMMENYGHGGVTSPNGTGIGEFTIYDWGNGAASAAYFGIKKHFGEKWLKKNVH